MDQSATESQESEVERILDLVRGELFAMWMAGDNGFITVHIGPEHGVVEVSRKMVKVKRKQAPVTPARKSWG